MAGRLEQKVAVITGGASGIGRASVELFVAEGARVVVGDIQDEAGAALAERLGSDVAFVHTDVTEEEQVAALVDAAVSAFGRLDVMFNNAGAPGTGGEIVELDLAGFDRSVDLLLRSVALGHKHAGRVMKAQGSGSIVSTASIAGLGGGDVDVSYSASKAAIINLVRTATAELGPFGVRSNAIAPGLIVTPIFSNRFPLEPEQVPAFDDRLAAIAGSVQPVPRAGRPEDIARAALFLASDEASFISGHTLVVDGGFTATLRMRLRDAVAGAYSGITAARGAAPAA
jgi:NAD(P)-dependent dehydrogenase (short-subunit alcohol dehydrogenase family)